MQEIGIGEDRASVAELIGKGGEGEVYAIEGRSGLAVKIYNPNLRAKREDKVRAMVGDVLAGKTDLVAYPGDVVTDRRGNFLGFVMRLVSGYRPLHELYSPKSRQRHFPKADYRLIVRASLIGRDVRFNGGQVRKHVKAAVACQLAPDTAPGIAGIIVRLDLATVVQRAFQRAQGVNPVQRGWTRAR